MKTVAMTIDASSFKCYKKTYDYGHNVEPVLKSKTLVIRRIMSAIVIAIIAPIHIVLWVPICCTLWIPYCFYQLSHWLVKGETKVFFMRVNSWSTTNSEGIYYWYRWGLLTEIYREIIKKWTKGKSKFDYRKAEKEYERDLLLESQKEEEEKKIAPYMPQLNKDYPGMTV